MKGSASHLLEFLEGSRKRFIIRSISATMTGSRKSGNVEQDVHPEEFVQSLSD